MAKRKKESSDRKNRAIIREARAKLKGYSGKKVIIRCCKCGRVGAEVKPHETDRMNLYNRPEMKEHYQCMMCLPPGKKLKDVFVEKGIKPWW